MIKMPAVQKRIFSEVTQTIQDPGIFTSRPIKKLRLTKTCLPGTTSIITLLNVLESCLTSNDALQILMKVSDSIQFEENELSEIIKKLNEHYRREKESAVRVKILSIFGDLVSEAKVDGSILIDEILNLLKSETSSKVSAHGLHTMNRIGTIQSLPVIYINKIVNFAISQLTSSSHNVQKHGLLLIGTFSQISDTETDNLNLVGRYTDSQDARVRAEAFRTILRMGERGVLTPTLYSRAVEALKDDYECVRKEALQLVYELANRHPDHMVAVSDSDSQLRLIDAAFGNVCSAICDLSMQVRTQAAELLGGMVKVSCEFLHQTLDKKLMSNMRRKKSLHERNMDHFTSGEWSSGKKWADDAPKEQMKADSISLMASGACGALVHGLEDEFLEVRTASVNSLCRLALINSDFAVSSLDFLVDMFNDEIEEVRLKAIFSLTAISEHIILREDQLETMLSSLEDFAVEVREGLHIMLGACKVSTQACLTLVVQKLLDVLSKYPQDKSSAFGCLQKIGQKHPELCMSLTPQLLQDHPFFDSAEKDVEDPAYVCILIMLFNAAQFMPAMLSLFPETTIKHYAYLRDTMPNFVPSLPVGGTSRQMALTGSTGSLQFLKTLLHNIEAAHSAPRARQALLDAAQDNLDRLALIDPLLTGTANFTAAFLGAELLIEQLQSCILPQHNKPPSKAAMNQLTQKCLKLQNLFSGLTTEDKFLVKQISIRASALQLIIIVKDRSQSALAPCQILLYIASDANQFFIDHPNVVPDSFTTAMLTVLLSLSDPKPGRVFREILPIVQSASLVAIPQINTNIKMCTTRIIDPCPSNSSDNVIKVTAGLIAALPFVAEIDNLQESQRQDLRIRIKYPDQNVHFFIPRVRDLKRILTELGEEENNWRLRTTVLLSHSVWTEATQVDISLCLSVRPGTEIELCKPVKILFSPTPVKRGI